MQVHQNALDSDFAKELFKDSHDRFIGQDASWSTNYAWQPNIVKASHPVLTRAYDDATADKIIDNLIENNVIPHRDFSVMTYVWTKLAYIAWHGDDKYDSSLTVYLNEYWDPDWGGVFLYKENLTDTAVKGIIPTFNTAVINTRNLQHCITPVGLDAGAPRITIQMFSKRPRKDVEEAKKFWAFSNTVKK
jgi:hypothetical protein